MYQDIGFFNLKTLKSYYLANAHNGKVTGISHFSDQVLISTSFAGELKVWTVEGDAIKVHQESIQRLQSNFNPQNAKL